MNVASRVDFSVVIPCYRCEGTIERALRSVVQQTYPPIEVIIVDDGSGEDTSRALAEYVECTALPVQIISLASNSGPGVARNIGWAAARANWVAFLDSDDAWHRRKLERIAQSLIEHPGVDAIGHLTAVDVSRRLDESEARGDGSLRRVKRNQILLRNVVSSPAMVVRRTIPERFPARHHAEDYELWAEIVLRGREMVILNEVLAYNYKRPWGDGGLSDDLSAMEHGELAMFKSLKRKGLITGGLCYALSGWSYVKHVRRRIIARMRA